MDARKTILKSIRRHELTPVGAPSLECGWTCYEDSRAQFLAALVAVGGHGESVADASAALDAIHRLADFRTARQVCSLVAEVPSRGVQLDAIKDPHEFEKVDWAIVPGELGVAENGAIWVTQLPSLLRVLPFIAQRLIVLLPAERIVDNMHQAYDQIQLGQAGFGVFISGPSKTADIEQSLVIGAHGPRSLNVFLVE